MSSNAYSYLIFGYKLDKNWLRQDDRYDKYEAMICGARDETVLFFEDEYLCYVGLPLSITRDHGIEATELDVVRLWSTWVIDLARTLQEKGLHFDGSPALHTFHLWR